tara:strand:+ start:87 stop:473 length:387 start_codon:yes stop_codon:yes gene_type:complete
MIQLKNFYLIKLIFFLTYIFYSPISNAENNKKEIIFNEITKNLRCMTCQNQTVYESDTEFSKQIKNEILKQLDENKSKKDIINYIVDRYGEYILLKPELNKKNIFLWIFPFLLVIASFLVLFLKALKK